MSHQNSLLHSWFCRKSWSLRRKGIPTSPQKGLRLRSPKWLHLSEMPRSHPCVTNVAVALSVCMWSCRTITALTVAQTWNKGLFLCGRPNLLWKACPRAGHTPWRLRRGRSVPQVNRQICTQQHCSPTRPCGNLVPKCLDHLLFWKFLLTLLLSLLIKRHAFANWFAAARCLLS